MLGGVMTIRITSISFSLVLFVCAGPAASSQNGCTRHDNFPQQCNPFGSGFVSHPIDNACGLSGDATEAGDQAQDKMKNNLCASGTPQELTFAELGKLQQGVDESHLRYGNRHIHHNLPPTPVDRQNFFQKEKANGFAEGDPVLFVGFIVETKAGNPESVNCHCSGASFNDIHIQLADHPLHLRKAPANSTPAEKVQIATRNNRKLCLNSFTAELIPHFRPAAFGRVSLNKLKDKKVVKVSGQLFFDAAHHPCKRDKPGRGDPARVASWEIHPVYDIQVCKKTAVADCKADDASVWQALQ
jgi:hypothetical protein